MGRWCPGVGRILEYSVMVSIASDTLNNRPLGPAWHGETRLARQRPRNYLVIALNIAWALRVSLPIDPSFELLFCGGVVGLDARGG